MKTKTLITIICSLIICNLLYSQNITNTLGTSGVFKIKDGATDYFSLSQSNGYLNLNRSLVLPNTTSSTTGVIFKGTDRFIHNYGQENTFVGINSGNFSTTGLWNTAIGYSSLSSNTTGSVNVAVGAYSLRFNTTGGQNTAVGFESLLLNNGFGNSALGLFSLRSNTTGNNNSAFGSASLYNNTTGFDNTSVGNNSLYSNTTGTQNTAVGYDALRNNVTGWQNTAIGHHSLINNTGNYNTAIGYNSGSTVTTGENLTLLGIDANPSSPTASNQITLGNQFVGSLRCNVQSITSLSDARDKKNISELSLGLDFITKLHPRQFNWDKREWYDNNTSDGSKMTEAPTAGFIAQELDEAQTTAGVEWLNLVLKDNPEKWEATYGNLLPVMVKAIQELKAENDKLKTEIENMRIIEERLAKLELNQIRQSNNVKEVILTQE